MGDNEKWWLALGKNGQVLDLIGPFDTRLEAQKYRWRWVATRPSLSKYRLEKGWS